MTELLAILDYLRKGHVETD